MTDFTRREMLGFLGVALMSGAFGCSGDQVENAARATRELPAQPFTRKFFTDGEWETVRALSDIVIPRDERSGSATDAAVPEFMDFILDDSPSSGETMRKGLAWLEAECGRRFGKSFAVCTAEERTAVVDDIAWPDRAKATHKEGVDFFNQFRNLVATGFWSSRMGVEDLQYVGNTYNPGWNGCPPAAMEKLGVRYA